MQEPDLDNLLVWSARIKSALSLRAVNWFCLRGVRPSYNRMRWPNCWTIDASQSSENNNSTTHFTGG